MILPEESNEKADKVEKPEDAAAVITQYEDIIWTKKFISIEYHQEKVFKRFEDKEKLIKLVNEFKIHKSTITYLRYFSKFIWENLRPATMLKRDSIQGAFLWVLRIFK